MRIAVIGAGPAGLTAGYRLQQAGHQIEVIEALPLVGGRTHAEHFGPGHHCDSGAGWLATFYSRTLALLEEVGCRYRLRDRVVCGASDIQVGGRLYRLPFTAEAIAASPLLPQTEKAAFVAYGRRLVAEQTADLEPDVTYDGHDAATELAPLGPALLEYVMRPTFEGPFYTRLESLSAAMVRSWMRALQGSTFYQVAGGMDVPWLWLAERMDVRVDEPVEAVRPAAGGVEVVTRRGSRVYEGVVLAVPAPVAARIASPALEGLPEWLGAVAYSPEVRVYAARQTVEDADIAVNVVPATTIGTVEFSSGRHGAWGACPVDWQWALVAAHGSASGALLEAPADQVTRALWDAARSIVPTLFRLEDAGVVYLMRWEWAVPVIGPGHFTRVAGYHRRPPVVLAGDWTHQACIEGAVRSGEAAAVVFGRG